MIKKCFICKKEFNTTIFKVDNGRGKFCSKKCYWISKKGKPSWNKGTKGIMKAWNKGKKRWWKSPSFKKGHIPWNKGKEYIQIKGKNNPNWNGGKYISRGYICIASKNHPRRGIRGYVYEHHLIIEKYLGRYLHPKEVVHHINGVRDDNRFENLMLFSNNTEHIKFHKTNPAPMLLTTLSKLALLNIVKDAL